MHHREPTLKQACKAGVAAASYILLAGLMVAMLPLGFALVFKLLHLE